MGALPRTLHPALNPAGYMAAASAIYAAVTAIYNAYNHHGALSAPVIIAALTAVASLLTRQVVTPVADPKDGNGDPLVTAAVPPTGDVHIVAPRPVDPPPAG